MQIINYVDLLLGAIINIFLYAFVIKYVFKINVINNKKFAILYILLTSFFVFIVNIFNKTTFKVLLTIPFVITGMKYTFNIRYRNSIIYVIVGTLYTFISEIIVGIVLSLLPFDYTLIFNNILGTTIGAIFVTIFTVPLLLINSLNSKVIEIVNKINKKNNVSLFILIFIAIGAFGYNNFMNINNLVDLVMNAILFISFVIIFIIYFEENAKLYELSKNYNDLFKYLEKYEKELVEKRKIIHDYKNQLIVINGYIGSEDKLREYLKEIIKEQKNIKENSIIRNIDKLPKGIKGLIYYKFSHINDNIVIDMQVKNKLTKFDKLNPKVSKDTLKILGILIDNAIDAVSIEKNKYINIVFEVNKNILKISITNPCITKFKKENLMKSGYSTKGKNRGYGLALVKDILKNDNSLSLNIINENSEFKAILEIKL